jgi:hypothetical protein
MTARPHCQFPDACLAKGAGHCRRCNGTAQMHRLNANPVFRQASGIRRREQLCKFLAGSEAVKSRARVVAQSHSVSSEAKRAATTMRRRGVPDGGEEIYSLARRNKLPVQEAVAVARAYAAQHPLVMTTA